MAEYLLIYGNVNFDQKKSREPSVFIRTEGRQGLVLKGKGAGGWARQFLRSHYLSQSIAKWGEISLRGWASGQTMLSTVWFDDSTADRYVDEIAKVSGDELTITLRAWPDKNEPDFKDQVKQLKKYAEDEAEKFKKM